MFLTVFRKINLITLLLATVLLTVTLPSCGDDVIKIGIIEPETGSLSDYGKAEIRGILTAYSVKNKINGKKVKLIKYNSDSNSDKIAQAANKLVDQKVSIVIGGWGYDFYAHAGPIFSKANITVITPGNTGLSAYQNNIFSKDSSSESDNCFFSVNYAQSFQGELLARYVRNEFTHAKAAIISDINDSLSASVRKEFIYEFGSDNILAEAFYNKGENDFSGQVDAVLLNTPDVILLLGEKTETAAIINHAVQAGYTGDFLGTNDWMDTNFSKLIENIPNTCLFADVYDIDAFDSDENDTFVYNYYKNNTIPPDSSAALGYDAYMLAIAVLETVGTDDYLAIRRSLENFHFSGITGGGIFDEYNNFVKKQGVIRKIESGEFPPVSAVITDNINVKTIITDNK